ncbi:MAG: ATP-binding protein, partial [Proteobacteria bacterium]|nr:ATP-binding protein [Pseudomonadota bacterium]
VSSKNAEIVRKPFELHHLAQEIAETVKVSSNPDARFIHNVDENLLINADRELLYRAIGNLARNGAEAGAKIITIVVTQTGGQLLLDVADDGPGLPEKAQESLFLPFEGSSRAGGTGLGLAIAKEVAHLHGGELTLLRTGPDGTAFRFELPS